MISLFKPCLNAYEFDQNWPDRSVASSPLKMDSLLILCFAALGLCQQVVFNVQPDACLLASNNISDTQSYLNKSIYQLAATPRSTVAEKDHALALIKTELTRIGITNVRMLNYTGTKIEPQYGNPMNTKVYTSRNILAWIDMGNASTPDDHLNEPIVLLVSHYDSVAGTRAVFDNAAGVATILSVARTLASIPTSLSHQVWFLITDNEESLGSPQMGSLNFVFALPSWIKSRIKAVFNVDSGGAWSTEQDSQRLPPGFQLGFPM